MMPFSNDHGLRESRAGVEPSARRGRREWSLVRLGLLLLFGLVGAWRRFH
jgi:hypothetical protein